MTPEPSYGAMDNDPDQVDLYVRKCLPYGRYAKLRVVQMDTLQAGVVEGEGVERVLARSKPVGGKRNDLSFQ
jgi:hypothetical protein